jgi:hypothetical protein
MAEAVAAIGLAASVASLIEIGGKVVSRVRDYSTRRVKVVDQQFSRYHRSNATTSEGCRAVAGADY